MLLAFVLMLDHVPNAWPIYLRLVCLRIFLKSHFTTLALIALVLSVNLKRSTVKRYGCIFTCLTTRAIHLEVLSALDTNSFINALFRFISRRGRPSQIFSDHDTNFVGACHELCQALKECQNKRRLRHFLLDQSIDWCFNPSYSFSYGRCLEASHSFCPSSVKRYYSKHFFD